MRTGTDLISETRGFFNTGHPVTLCINFCLVSAVGSSLRPKYYLRVCRHDDVRHDTCKVRMVADEGCTFFKFYVTTPFSSIVYISEGDP